MRKEIITETLKLKIVEKSDANAIHLLRINPNVARFIKRDLNVSVLDIEHFITERLSDYENILFYKIEMFPNLELAGTIVLKNINRESKYAEIGYELFPKFEGQGIMSNALEKIIEMAFDNMGLEELEAFTNRNNLKSRRMLEKFKFNETEKVDDKNLNNVIYSLRKLP